MLTIQNIQLIGNEVAIAWSDGSENFYAMDALRAASPSAETTGERDLLGVPFAEGEEGKDFSGVTVTAWNLVGAYAIQFQFSDGHKTGIYAFDYLKDLGDRN